MELFKSLLLSDVHVDLWSTFLHVVNSLARVKLMLLWVNSAQIQLQRNMFLLNLRLEFNQADLHQITSHHDCTPTFASLAVDIDTLTTLLASINDSETG